MSSVVISGDTSGTVSIAAPAVAGSNTLTLLAATATNSVNTLSTAVATTSGTSVDFTALPSWIKRITVMYNGVSTSGTSTYLVQLGTGSTTFTTSGYNGAYISSAGAGVATSGSVTAGFPVFLSGSATDVVYGAVVITNVTGNTWVCQGYTSSPSQNRGSGVAAQIALAAQLTAVRITSVTPDTFDAGTVNILYEG